MKKVFLSYHHEDKKIAAEVKSELGKSGFTGFLLPCQPLMSRVSHELSHILIYSKARSRISLCGEVVQIAFCPLSKIGGQ